MDHGPLTLDLGQWTLTRQSRRFVNALRILTGYLLATEKGESKL